jgi:O-antigen ligase
MLGIKSLLILLLIILPFGELLRFNIGGNIYVKPLDIVACILTLWLTTWLLYKRNIQVLRFWPLGVFALAAFLSLAINSIWLEQNELITSSLYMVRWIGYLGVLIAVLIVGNNFKSKILNMLIIGGSAVVILGYLQYLFYSDIRHLVSIGWDDHMYRLFSTFYDPNFAGAFLVLFLLLIGGILYRSFAENNRKKSIMVGAIFSITLIAVLLTFSRSALIMLIIGGGIMLVLLQMKKLILALLAVIILYVIVISPNFYIENTNLFRAASTGARLETYGNAFTIYQDNPILGVGFNTYRYAQQDYGFRKEQPKYPSNADSGVDNSFLFVLATTGIVGFAAFLLMWGYMLKSALIHIREKGNIFAIVFFASTAGLFINAFFINSLFYPAIILWMWMLFGLVHREE